MRRRAGWVSDLQEPDLSHVHAGERMTHERIEPLAFAVAVVVQSGIMARALFRSNWAGASSPFVVRYHSLATSTYSLSAFVGRPDPR